MKLFLAVICTISLSTIVVTAQTTPTATATATTTTTTAAPDTTTTSPTENTGKITEFTPGMTIVLSSSSGESIRYKLAKTVTYINAKGKEIKAERIRKDRKVRVHYVKDGNDMVVDKVTVVRD
ncbi:MAG TPA: hypothetical protein VGM62_09760 [Chthoniobacterales bacterium]|jgi:hypothetical protein